jgi:hypothetical protein
VKGIEPTGFRDDSPGLKIINHEYNGIDSDIKAEIAAKSSINCLCTDRCVVLVEGNEKLTKIGNGKTIVIKDGKATIE